MPEADYAVLTEQSLARYIAQRPALSARLGLASDLEITEVGDGNLNLVFIVRSASQPERAAVVKQALPYLRVAGESWPLTRDRVRFEAQSLREYNRLVPGLAPEVYDFDPAQSVLAMEYLGRHVILRRPLAARTPLPSFADHISTFLARTLFYTSDLYLTGPEKNALQARFINAELCQLQEAFVYSHPFEAAPENRWNPLLAAEVEMVRRDAQLKREVAELKAGYLTHAQALLHGDLHTGSVMVTADETRVIDSEFAFYGPMGYDVGNVLAHLVLNCLAHQVHTPEAAERRTYQCYLLDVVREVWIGFAGKFEALWATNRCGSLGGASYFDFLGGEAAFAQFQADYLRAVMRDTIGHAGCEILRRLMGIVSVWELTSITDDALRATAERLALEVGRQWILQRGQFARIEDALAVVHSCLDDNL
ncbi:MAG: S-methyl-5-thioribose kinase [Anaerolineales bacterium]|nr:S-methyl-5-thioribose kinase [Anaerolineales bacterium]